jgi:hypothetical protein
MFSSKRQMARMAIRQLISPRRHEAHEERESVGDRERECVGKERVQKGSNAPDGAGSKEKS